VEHVASFIAVEEYTKEKTGLAQMTGRIFTLVSYLAHFSTLKMEEACFSETSVNFQRSIWHYTPDDRTLHNIGVENLQSYLLLFTS
jgi:hypothetical protein